MRRLLVLAAFPLLFASCGSIIQPKTPPFFGRWVSSSVVGNQSRVISLRLDPNGQFFGADINNNTGMQYTMRGTWQKPDPLTLVLTTDDGRQSYKVRLDEKLPTSTLTGQDLTATLERAPD
jgi:hypothetical protein